MAQKAAQAEPQAPAGFRSRKAAQICAYFASRSDGGRIDKLKLSKLVYLAERRFLAEHHRPMLFDDLYSLAHGPVCSSTLRGIEGGGDKKLWNDYIRRHGLDTIVAVKSMERQDLDHVSDAELKILDKIWRRFSGRSPSSLRNYTHTECSEYTEISAGSKPFSYLEVFQALGRDDAEELDREVRNMREFDELLEEYA